MNTQRDASGQNYYTPAPAQGGPDIFAIANQPQFMGPGRKRRPPKFTLQKLDRDGDLMYWKVELYDQLGGLNQQDGPFQEIHDRAASSTLDARTAGVLTLPPLITTATTPDPRNATPTQLYYVNIFDTLVVGTSGTTAGDKVLFYETSATDPTVLASAYDPDFAGGYTTNGHIWPAYIGSATASLQLVFARFNGANGAQVLSDTGGTVAGTMHAKLGNLSGLIQTGLPNRPLLLCANASSGAFNLYSLNGTSAINTDPGTATLTNLPFLEEIGLLSLAGGPARAYWLADDGLKPYIKGISVISQNSFKVVSTNQQGGDLLPVDVPAIDVIFGGFKLWDGFVVWNSRQIIFYNGRGYKSLRPFSDRFLDSNNALAVFGLWKSQEEELFMEVMQYRLNSSGAANTYWRERYDRELDCWQNGSEQFVTSLTAPNAKQVGRLGLPYSYSNRNLHDYIDGSWHRQFQPELGQSIFSLRKSSSGATSSGIEYAASGALAIPRFQVPGIENWPLVPRRISGSPDVDAGGTGGTPATVQVAIAGTSFASGNSPAIFKTGYQTGVNYGRGFQMFSSQDNSVVFELVVSITATRQSGGTDPTRFTPQCFPIVIEGVSRRPPGAVFTGFEVPDNRG